MFVGKNYGVESVIYSLACLIITMLTGWFELLVVFPNLNFLVKKYWCILCVWSNIM